MTIMESLLNGMIGTAFRMWPSPRPSDEKLANVRIVAHRGVHERSLAKENTLEAFSLALDAGLYGIEFDVGFTKDSVPVICHDPTTLRVFGEPACTIAELNASELRERRPEVPTLQEVIDLFGKKLHLMIEIKLDLRERPHLAAAVYECLKRLEPAKDYHLLSLEPEYLGAFPQLPKSSFVDVIWLSPKRILALNKRLGHGGVAGHFLFINQKEIDDFHRLNKLVGVGFLDSRNSLYREINRGADWIFTNHPLRINDILRNRA